MKLINPRTKKDFTGLAIPKKRMFPEPIEYSSMFAHGFAHLAKLKLSQNETAILFALLSRLEFENWVRVSQLTLAEDLNIKQQNVSTAIKKLVQLKVILRESDPSDRRRTIYRLNPSLGWRGDPKEWFECTAEKDYEPIPPCFVRSKTK